MRLRFGPTFSKSISVKLAAQLLPLASRCVLLCLEVNGLKLEKSLPSGKQSIPFLFAGLIDFLIVFFKS